MDQPENPPEKASDAESTAPPSQAASWARLLAVVTALLVAAGLLVWESRRAPPPPKTPFDARPLARVRARHPDFVVIGNSMAGTRIHERTLNAVLAPRSAVTITYGGSRAAVWYLIFKNYVVASGVHPTRAIIFFRYQELTELTYRDSGLDRLQIEMASPELDPVVHDKLFPPPEHPVKRLAWELGKVVPIDRLRVMAAEQTLPIFDRSTTWFASEPDPRRRSRELNAPFALERLRGADVALANQGTVVGDFASAVDRSFLPEMLSLAKSSGVGLAFVRVRPRAVAEGHPESAEMQRYVADLKRYVEAHGQLFVDMSSATWETADLYKNGDHLAPRVMPLYTRLFVENLPELFR